MSEARQAWLPFVGGLVLLANGGFHTAGAFVHGGHVVSAEWFVAKPAPARRLEDAGFHDHHLMSKNWKDLQNGGSTSTCSTDTC